MDQACKFGEQTFRILEFKPEGLDFKLHYNLFHSFKKFRNKSFHFEFISAQCDCKSLHFPAMTGQIEIVQNSFPAKLFAKI